MNILRQLHKQGYTYPQIAARIAERTPFSYAATSLSNASGFPQVNDRLAAILLMSFPEHEELFATEQAAELVKASGSYQLRMFD